MLFKEITPVYTEEYTKPIKTKSRVTDSWSMWYIYVHIFGLHPDDETYAGRSSKDKQLSENLMQMVI